MALDRQKIIDAFDNYVSNYDKSDIKVQLKIEHTYRVAENCDRIADSIELSEKDKDFAWLSGVLHDIGRFEQLRRYHTFQDKVSCNHAALSADILFKDREITRFVKENDIDFKMMEKVIRYHNVYMLPEKQDETERMFCHILRDADKIDILKVNCDTPRTEIYDLPEEEFRSSFITDAVLSDILNDRGVDRRNSQTGIDYILGHISFVFGLVFSESLRLVKEQGYLQQLLNFESENEDTKEKMKKVNDVVNEYITSKLETKDLYLMRHGQTIFNLKKMIQGWCDSPLTEEGIQQARAAGLRLGKLSFDHYYTSTSGRTEETLAEALGVKDYIRLKDLRERGFGIYEGESENSDKSSTFELYENVIDTYEGESREHLQERMYRCLDEIMMKPDHHSVLAVSHGNASYQFLKYVDPEAVKKLTQFGNCEVMHFTYFKHGFKFIEII